MGNLIIYSRPNSSVFDVIPNLKTLTNCTFYIGLREDIIKIYKNYIFYISKNFYVTRSELRRISRHTSLEGIEEIIFVYFLKPQFKRINIMELLAAIITYSFLDWEQKIVLGIQIFDFDGSKNLTEDEFFIMAKCFIYGISTMSQGISAENDVIKFLSHSLFINRAELTISELVMWVRQNQLLYEIFQFNQPNVIKHDKKKRDSRFGSLERKTVDLRKPVAHHRRVKSSFNDKREENFSVVIDSKIVTKQEIIMLKSQFDELSINGLVSFRTIFPVIKTLGYKLENAVDHNSDKQITFHDLLQMLFRRASKNQLLRLLKFIGESIRESMIFDEEEKPANKKKIVDPKLFHTYKMMFDKYDTNKDGRIDLKELKTGLKNTFTETTIENLFEKYNKEKKHGLCLREFVKMYAPENFELPENINK